MKKNIKLIGLLSAFCVMAFALLACNESPADDDEMIDKGDYTLKVKYDSIRSNPSGGGVFIVYIVPDSNFSGDVAIGAYSSSLLNAKIEKNILSRKDSIVEIVIKPSENIEPGMYDIEIMAEHKNKIRTKKLNVDIREWGSNINDAYAKLNQFKHWFDNNNNGYTNIFGQEYYVYPTYPETLIVEHYTFLNADYEIRLCYHVMVKPHDWSMMCIRKRYEIMPELALKMDSNGDITIIDIEDYPQLYGY